jgi:hypothetical protein
MGAASANRDYAINVLRFWWNASVLSGLSLTTFQDALAYYERTHPSFMDAFGKAAKSISISKARDAMEGVAKKSGSTYPDINTLFDALGTSAMSWDSDDTKAVAEGIVEDLQGSLKFGLGTVVVVAAVLGGLWLYSTFGGVAKRASA